MLKNDVLVMIINEALLVFYVVVFYNFFESMCKIINTGIQIICSTVKFVTSQNMSFLGLNL